MKDRQHSKGEKRRGVGREGRSEGGRQIRVEEGESWNISKYVARWERISPIWALLQAPDERGNWPSGSFGKTKPFAGAAGRRACALRAQVRWPLAPIIYGVQQTLNRQSTRMIRRPFSCREQGRKGNRKQNLGQRGFFLFGNRDWKKHDGCLCWVFFFVPLFCPVCWSRLTERIHVTEQQTLPETSRTVDLTTDPVGLARRGPVPPSAEWRPLNPRGQDTRTGVCVCVCETDKCKSRPGIHGCRTPVNVKAKKNTWKLMKEELTL